MKKRTYIIVAGATGGGGIGDRELSEVDPHPRSSSSNKIFVFY